MDDIRDYDTVLNVTLIRANDTTPHLAETYSEMMMIEGIIQVTARKRNKYLKELVLADIAGLTGQYALAMEDALAESSVQNHSWRGVKIHPSLLTLS